MDFWAYLLRRSLAAIPTLIGVLLVLFVIFTYMGNSAAYSTHIPAENGSFGSFAIAFFTFIYDVLTGNWGVIYTSPKSSAPYSGSVSGAIGLFFPFTLQVVLISVPIALMISFPLGRYLGTHYHGKFSSVLRGGVIAGYVTPAYAVGLLLQTIFGKDILTGDPLGVLPYYGWLSQSLLASSAQTWLINNGQIAPRPTHLILLDSLIHGDLPVFWSAVDHLILPIITLVVGMVGVVTMMLESGYAENMGLEYVRSARARGTPERRIVFNHVRRNAILPPLVSASIMVAYLLSNIVMMEYVFSYPGIGYFLIETMTIGQYYPAIVIIFLFAIIMIISSIAVDAIYFLKNPLVRY
ncbi:MAG: ABC transporter permease [Candidatus Thermoplasmatota archaeon]|jgi:peptide/nickel transport system permease protein|nr:ABC transporter permease [Candidatus Thermoplasmatota archaeon]